MHQDIQINTYIGLHTYIHTYIHTYMHTYIHTYIHTCIHTYMCAYIHVLYCIYCIVLYLSFSIALEFFRTGGMWWCFPSFWGVSDSTAVQGSVCVYNIYIY